MSLMERPKKVLFISTDRNLREVLEFCFDGWGYEVFVKDTPLHDITVIKKISPDVIVVDVHSASKSHLEICRLLKDDFMTAFTPVITLVDKRQLREQLLNIKQGIDDYLIKPPDPLDLRVRIDMAIKRSQYSFYASPLTGLPGGRIIEEVLHERIKKETPFTFGYIDIDNFKYFNDMHGYLKGDAVIMQTAYLLYNAIKKFGNPQDFIGHVGGDDFVFVTTVEKYKDACHDFVSTFDAIIPYHYCEEERLQGFVVARDRTKKLKKIPLMSVSVALVNKKDRFHLRNTIEINEKIAEIKRYLKSIEGSKFMADRRSHTELHNPKDTHVVAGQVSPQYHKPLGQILLERRFISAEQLDEALKIHWRRGIIFGEVLKELGFVTDEPINEALAFQKSLRHKAHCASGVSSRAG